MSGHVVIIGAGIVGVSAGIRLRRMGAEVTIIGKSAPGQGTSYGNAGVLAASAMVPVAMPGLILKGPKTGRLAAGLITRQPTNVDLPPDAPRRFGR